MLLGVTEGVEDAVDCGFVKHDFYLRIIILGYTATIWDAMSLQPIAAIHSSYSAAGTLTL